MLKRIAFWAVVGAAVAFVWFVVILAMPRGQGPSASWPVVTISMPFMTFAFARHMPITWYESIALNAVCYACIGLLLELIWMGLRPLFPRHGSPGAAMR
jgi:hypothetical protein